MNEPSRVGQVLSGYRIERLLGSGSMGEVYLGRSGNDTAVVKLLAPAIAANPDLRIRFQREWEVLAKLPPHPNVVAVRAVRLDDAQPHLIMEYIPGSSLGSLIRQGPMAPDRVARVGRDAAAGLAVVHRHGLIHRDVKPDNLILTPQGRTCLVDFGIAKDLFRSTLTEPDQLLGTPAYMAPEQWEDEAQADARCDVFALGATLYHLLAGRPPFEGEDFFEIADKALAGDFRPLREAAPGVSQGLDRIVTTMLSASVRYRYGSMEDCVRDLEGLARGQAPELPRIERASGPALLLADRTQLVLGRGVDSDERLDHPSVANTHAEVRREAKGYVLCDLRSETGTFVEGERVTFVPRLLEDGDRIRLGQVELVLRDPRGRTGGAAFLQDLVRRELPGAVVAALVATADPRAIATLLELLSPDRSLSAEVAAVLTPLLGEAVARQVVAYVQREELRRVDWARSHLAAIAGAPHDDWLSWWWGRRGQHPVQIGATRPARGLALEVAAGAAEPTRLALDDAGVVLVGSDPRCHLRCAGPRLRLTLLRLHRRFLARAEPGAGVRHGGRPFVGAVLDVGDVLELGAVSLRLSAAAPRPQEQTPRGRHVLAPLACEALRELTHPAVASGLAAALGEPDQDAWIVPVARDLFQGDARGERAFDQQVRAQLTARAKRAQAALPQILGREVSASDLAEIGEGLGPQVVPRGWLAETR